MKRYDMVLIEGEVIIKKKIITLITAEEAHNLRNMRELLFEMAKKESAEEDVEIIFDETTDMESIKVTPTEYVKLHHKNLEEIEYCKLRERAE